MDLAWSTGIVLVSCGEELVSFEQQIKKNYDKVYYKVYKHKHWL